MFSPQTLLKWRACPKGHTTEVWMDIASVRRPSLLDVLLASSFLTATQRLCYSKMGAGPMFLSQCGSCVPLEIPVARPLPASPAT